MGVIHIRGGHCFRLKGEPRREVVELPRPQCVALCPRGFALKPRITVKVGQSVAIGQELMHDKTLPAVKWTAPAGGTIEEIRFGHRRVLQAIVIGLPQNSEDERSTDFGAVSAKHVLQLDRAHVADRLLTAGLWPVLQRFPGGGLVPKIEEMQALYVSAVPGEPHSPHPTLVLSGCQDWFALGLQVLSRLVPQMTVFTTPSVPLTLAQMDVPASVGHCVIEERTPAHHVGVQHYTTRGPWPTGQKGCVAGVDVDGVIQVGHLFATGQLRTQRLYAVGGQAMAQQLHVRGRIGLCVQDLVGGLRPLLPPKVPIESRCFEGARGVASKGPLAPKLRSDTRLIAGGLLTGRSVELSDFLGFADKALQGVVEDQSRPLLAFLRLGMDKLTLSRAWGSALLPTARRGATASAHGEERACIQCGACLSVCPTELMPNVLFKAALAQDMERMEQCGIQDCVDCGLCTFVCPSKIELGQHIERGKQLIAKEG